jgi:RNA polymerase sigma-70 factor (ECF subfamily)
MSPPDVANNGSHADEAALLAALRAGDESAYETLVRTYGGRMLAVARRFLRNEQDAQDAVQDAFISAFKSIDNFEGGSRLSTWLHRIVVNAALMKLRSQQRRPERPIDDLLPKFQADGHPHQATQNWAVTIDTAVQDRDMRRFIREKIDELPDSHRNVLLLRDIEEHTTEETAQLLGITPGAVKTRLHRARLALRELLDPHMKGGAA